MITKFIFRKQLGAISNSRAAYFCRMKTSFLFPDVKVHADSYTEGHLTIIKSAQTIISSVKSTI